MDRLPDDARIRVWQGLMRVHADVATALDQALMGEHRLPLSWYQVLVELRLAGGSMRMHRLAEAATLSRSATTRLVDRIEDAGLVERRVCPEDRRGTEVVLTEQGRKVQRGAAPTALRGLQQLLGRHLTQEQAETLAALLEMIVGGQAASRSAEAETPPPLATTASVVDDH